MPKKYVIPGQPIPKGRPRASGRGKFIRMYTPKKTKEHEEHIRKHVEPQKRLINYPIHLHANFYLKIPKSFTKKRTQFAVEGRLRPITRVDTDNLVKCLGDALNSHIYEDDKFIVKITAEKWYSDNPRTEFYILNV